jgi:hypothetical protein
MNQGAAEQGAAERGSAEQGSAESVMLAESVARLSQVVRMISTEQGA